MWHIRTFQRYFDSLTQKASRLFFITTITVHQWIWDAVWRASIQGWKNIGSQGRLRPLCRKRWSSVFIRWRLKSLFVHWSVHQLWKMRQNQWLELPNWHAASQNEQTLCRRQRQTSSKEIAGRRKNWDAWSYMIIKSYEQTFVASIHARSCKGACHTLDCDAKTASQKGFGGALPTFRHCVMENARWFIIPFGKLRRGKGWFPLIQIGILKVLTGRRQRKSDSAAA